ncbi:MAG: ATP-binding protein [Deltaproteobacteria bacterium]|nr:ATP-binding protein [Deltaproteobacteria bacterium]
MFRTSVPATADFFFDRDKEIARLEGDVAKLRKGAPSWVAILGARKVGKTSLVLELARRMAGPKLAFVVLDVFESLPVSFEIFRRFGLRVVDTTLGQEVGASIEALADNPADLRAALQQSARFTALPPGLRATILDLPDHAMEGDFFRRCLDLPEQLATALGLHVVVAWDEFQELSTLPRGKAIPDPLPLMRTAWQKHQRVGYVISGSARSMLLELVTSKRSPFFQHFAIMDLEPFPAQDGIAMLTACAPADRPIPKALAARAVDSVGGHPFYLQLLGEALTLRDPPYDEACLKDALQNILFSRTGRLALYFENEYARVVGRSTFLATALSALAKGPRRLSEIATEIGTGSGSTVRYLERLGDAVVRLPDARYGLADPTFGLWLAWRQPGGTVVPMKLVGDEAEIRTAAHLARLGFDLVYQSRASRGAFDLLATRGAIQLGVQVKRSPLPVRFDRAEWARMRAEAERFGWRWAVAVLTPPPEERLLILDPERARRTRAGFALDAAAEVENVLAWLDQSAPGKTRRRRRA